MRCALCDRIVAPPRLGRLPDGRLVFGWCLECMRHARCEILDADEPAKPLARIPFVPHSKSRKRAFRDGRRLALLGIAGLLSAWAVILGFFAGLRIPGRMTEGDVPASPFGNGTHALLVAGTGAMSLLSIAFWVIVLRPGRRGRFVSRFVQVAATITAFAALAWGVIRHDPRRNPTVVGIVAAALAVSAIARHFERKAEGVELVPSGERAVSREDFDL